MFDITHYTFSKKGGAGIVANTLNSSLVELGHNSKLQYYYENSIKDNFFRDKLLTTTAIIDQYLVKNNNFKSLFSLYRKSYFYNPKFESSIIHLHWITGLSSNIFLDDLSNHKSGVVWTLHDMEPFTGGCHQSLECINYRNECKSCPAVKALFQKRVESNYKNKMINLNSIKNLILVLPSSWMMRKISEIKELHHVNQIVIENPIDDIFFQPSNNNSQSINIPKFNKNILTLGFVANNINEPLKNFSSFHSIIKKIIPKVEMQIRVLIVGNYNKKFSFPSTVEVIYLNEIKDKQRLKYVYSNMDVLISTSLSESFGLTVAESQACGVYNLILGGSASENNIINNETGKIFFTEDQAIDSLLYYIHKLYQTGIYKIRAQNWARKNWFSESVVNKYLDVYSLLQR